MGKRTLADVMAHPPSGWVCVGSTFYLNRNGDACDASVLVGWDDGEPCWSVSMCDGGVGRKDLLAGAEVCRSVAELMEAIAAASVV